MNWSLLLWILIPSVLVILVIRYLYRTYNELTYYLLKVEKKSSDIEAFLKKKFDLIPALADVVRGYAKHEKDTFKEITDLRSKWGKTLNFAKKIKTANQIDSILSRLLVIQERYPKLKADKRFKEIMKSLREVENELVKERKKYNEYVRKYNVRVKLFPKNIIATIFKFKERPFYSRE